MKFKEYISENKSDYKTIHKSYTSAVQEVKSYIIKNNYTIDDEDWDQEITFANRRPSKGKYSKHTIPLYKNGKKQKKALQFQVYGLDSGNYELNLYIL